MSSDPQRDVLCPRCRYNLRGLTTPRCPECGFEFEFAQLETGLLRENKATWVDRCDRWQPHQILVGSLYELVHGVLRPRWLLSTLDVNGPLAAAGLMLAGGLLWVWLLTGALAALAIVLHAGASPAAALRAGLLVWGPTTLLPALVVSLGLVAPIMAFGFLRVARPTLRQRLRPGAYLLPTFTAYSCLPLAIGLCAAPDFALGVPFVWVVLPFFVWVSVVRSELAGSANTALSRAAAALGVGAVGVALGVLLAGVLMPDSLAPPAWVYLP